MTETPFIEFTTFDVETREMLQLMRVSTIQDVDLQCSEGVSYVFGHWKPGRYIIGDDGEPVEKA